MGRILRYLTLVVAATTLSCCYDCFRDEPNGASSLPVPNITIRELSELLQTNKLIIYDNMIVQGSVTTTDQNGNFYKSFIIENSGYALEVLEGMYDSYVRHDIGAVVSIKLQGLALSRDDGVVQVGVEAPVGSNYILDYLKLGYLVDRHIFCSDIYKEVSPCEVKIGEFTQDMCGRLVKIESLRHIPNVDDTQPYVWEGYQEFSNGDGNLIYCYTSEYANFSRLPIPQSEVSLCGILKYNNIRSEYVIYMRGVDDCTL